METLLTLSSFDKALAYREIEAELIPRCSLAKVHIIDVRERDEFYGELGHMDGASLVPLATLPHLAQNWDREGLYLMVCRSGRRSGRAAQLLIDLGFEQVVNLRGGMLALRALHSQAGPG